MKTPKELASADEVIRDYSLPNSWVDQGNLYFAATEYKAAYENLQEENEIMKSKILELSEWNGYGECVGADMVDELHLLLEKLSEKKVKR